MKKVLFIGAILMMLVSCGGGSGSNSNSNTSITTNNGVAQKGPFSVGSEVLITQINSFGTPTGETIKSEVSSKNGNFSFETVNTEPNVFYRINVTGKAFNEDAGSVLDSPITLSSITNNLKNTSVNVLTHWVSKRIDSLLAEGKNLETSLDQSQNELTTIFGISDANSLDMTAESSSTDEDSAMLLLLSGALMEASAKYAINPQTVINEISEDFADDGQLSEKGDDWFIRIQSIIKNNPKFHAKKYTKNLRDHLGYNVVSEKNLPTVIPLASRPVANLPSELLAEPGETIILDGSASNDGGDIINFTWFRVDQQTQYDIQVSDRFSPTPFITLPDEAIILAAPNQEISLLYALVVTDVDKLTHTGVVKVTVRIPPISNNPPVADSQTLITDEDTPINITLSASDVDGDQINYTLNTPLATPNGIVELDTNLPNIIYTPAADYSGSDSFSFLVNDGFENSNTATIDIQVNPVNDPPLADAGVDQTAESTSNVVLNGSGVDVDGTIEAFSWNQSEGSSVVLNDSTIVNPSFSAPIVTSIAETLRFDLTVTDNDGADSIADSVDIVINPQNEPPVANAGAPQTVTSGDTVTLNGSGMDSDGTVEAYIWSQNGGPTASLNNSTFTNPTFTAPIISTTPVILTFELIVTDDDGDSSGISSVEITVNPPINNKPVANAGPDQFTISNRFNFGSGFQEATAQLTLDGSVSSDVEDNISDLSFDWTQLSGPVSVDPDNVIMPSFNITGGLNQDIDGDYVFRLIVTDTNGEASDPDEITISVGPNLPPTATDLIIPFDLSNLTTSITLVGNDPDGNNTDLVYEIVTLPAPFRGRINFSIGDIPGNNNIVEYQSNSISSPDPDNFTYRVRDPQGLTSNIATVNLTEPNTPPTARAGFNRVYAVLGFNDGANNVEESTVSLDGSRSSDNEDASTDLIYEWRQISGPVTIPASDIGQIAEPSFVVSSSTMGVIAGDYVFELTVTDSGGLVSVDDVGIRLQRPGPGNKADPGVDRDVIELTTVQVYGQATPLTTVGGDNSIIRWEWTQIDIIPGTEVDLVFDPIFEQGMPTFIAPAVNGPTEIRFRLVVYDREFNPPSIPEFVTYTVYPTGTVLANVKPTAFDQNITINANGTGALFELTGNDLPDGDNLALTYRIIGLADDTQGSIRAQTRNFVYTPVIPVVQNSLTFVAIDQDGAESDPATVTFTPRVSPPGNTAPVAQDITLNIDPPLNSSNSRQLLSYDLMVQDAENDNFVINEISKNDVDVRFSLLNSDLRMDNRVRSTAASGTFEYRAIDIYGNVSNTATITINYNN